MRSPYPFVVAALLLGPHLTGAATPAAQKPAPAPPSRVEPPPAEAVRQIAQSSNAFGFDFYQRLRQKPGNLVMSPASITTSLAMAWGGARGETAAQMQKVLHLQGTAGEVMATSGQLVRSLQDPSGLVVFRVANQLFGEKTFHLVPAFRDQTAAAYGAPVELLDFKKAPEKSRVHVNQWVEDKTSHRVKDLIPPGAVSEETRLVLVNAIYFLGDWEKPFERNATYQAPFFLTATEKKDVPTMRGGDYLRLAQADGVTAVELPYEGRQLSMLFLVPDKVDGLAAVESALDAKKLDTLVSAMKRQDVWLELPKFEVNPGDSLSLGDDLKEMGMPLAFDRQKADFTGIADPPDPADRPVLAKVFHKAFVRVDETGTEAAAASASLDVRGGAGAGLEPPHEVKVNRPFLFLIRDNASGLVLFLGRVTDPSGK
ncbi:MAG TPA: serpin family protein [Thermoanaerobaculia bacterium]|nr:serpin family protein [Thermoanaerobaculia bacterium]